ncbi:helix-turn-helix domain-containing protein [Bradyrhizobium sp. CW7]|uniref:TetR/AcrR family transcriptional regulator n=1 Tax=Bradyrhizobium sp. CW7 TaxID=2782688 RepID=UPI0032084A36
MKAAARPVFARDGFLNSTISEIMKEAQRSIGVFYRYYKSKDALCSMLEFPCYNWTSPTSDFFNAQDITEGSAIETLIQVAIHSSRGATRTKSLLYGPSRLAQAQGTPISD